MIENAIQCWIDCQHVPSDQIFQTGQTHGTADEESPDPTTLISGRTCADLRKEIAAAQHFNEPV